MQRSLSIVFLCAALFSSAAAVAADTQKQSAAGTKQYAEDRLACMSQSDQAACMRETAAARAEAKRGGLDEGQSAAYEQNRLARCGYLPEADREDCARRMRGEGTTSGSVSGGGIYRELRSTVPAPETEGEASSGASK